MSTSIDATSGLGTLATLRRGLDLSPELRRGLGVTLADDIVYVEGGRVVDHGTHEQLRERCEGYERLVTAYAREAAERAAVAADEEEAVTS